MEAAWLKEIFRKHDAAPATFLVRQPPAFEPASPIIKIELDDFHEVSYLGPATSMIGYLDYLGKIS